MSFVKLSRLLTSIICKKDLTLFANTTILRQPTCIQQKSQCSRQSVGTNQSKLQSTYLLGDSICNEKHSTLEDSLKDSEDNEVFEPINPDKGAQELLLIKLPEQPNNPRCVRVAIIGTPNAGKSTLVNALLRRRICAVSKKVHTTRRQATGVLTEKDTQMIILDTPGMVTKMSARRHSLPRELIVSPKSTMELADLFIVIVDVADKWTCRKLSTDILLELNNFQNKPCALVLNKVDIIKNKQSLVELTAILTEGVVDGKPIEMSGRLTKKLLKNKAFREKYLHYKSLSDCENDEIDSERVTSTEETASLSKKTQVDALVNEDENIGLHEPKVDANEFSDDNDHNYNGSKGLSLEERNLEGDRSNEAGSELDFLNNDVDIDPKKVEILEQYVNYLHSASQELRMKISEDNVEKDQQLEANKMRQILFKELNKHNGWHLFERVFMISAKSGDGVQQLKDYILEKAKPEDWEYHHKVVTDLSPLEIVEEAIREQLLECLPQEIPYNVEQRNMYWEYDENGTLLINQRLTCFKKSHFTAVLRRIRTIAKFSEQDLMNAFHCDVLLKLSVKLSK